MNDTNVAPLPKRYFPPRELKKQRRAQESAMNHQKLREKDNPDNQSDQVIHTGSAASTSAASGTEDRPEQ
jgi:hypothetical protein